MKTIDVLNLTEVDAVPPTYRFRDIAPGCFFVVQSDLGGEGRLYYKFKSNSAIVMSYSTGENIESSSICDADFLCQARIVKVYKVERYIY